MLIQEEKIIESKKASYIIKWINIIIFLSSLSYILLYQFVLIKIQAHCMNCFELGSFTNTLLYSVVTGYVFYFLTSVLPAYIIRNKMKPIVTFSKRTLANELDILIKALTQTENWMILTNKELKEKVDSLSSTRRIWSENGIGIYNSQNEILLLNPTTLTIIDQTLDKIVKTINDILSNWEYIDEQLYLKGVVWLKNSTLIKKLSLCKEAANIQFTIDSTKPLYQNGQTYLDNFFINELSLHLFTNIDNCIFIDEIRSLMKGIHIDNL